MKIKEPIVFQIGYRTWCINEFGMDTMFLLEGDDKALLIDTGTSVFNLPELIRRYTKKPLLVAITHGHFDHAGGMSWFKEVYLHPADFDLARGNWRAQREEYVSIITGWSDGLYDLTPAQVVDGPFQTELLPLCDHMVFHLGNRNIVAYETPGHTKGSVSFLDVSGRTLYTGDACNSKTMLPTGPFTNCIPGTISELLSSAEKIERLHPYYDRNYNGHIGYAAGITNMEALPERLTRDCIALCKNLLDGNVTGEPVDDPFCGNCLSACGNTLQLLYTSEQLR